MWCSGLYCAGVKGQGPDLRGHTTRIPQSLDIMTWPCDLQQRWLCCVVSRSCLLCGIICQHVKKAADKTWGESRGRGEGSDKSMEFLHVPLWYLSLTKPSAHPHPSPRLCWSVRWCLLSSGHRFVFIQVIGSASFQHQGSSYLLISGYKASTTEKVLELHTNTWIFLHWRRPTVSHLLKLMTNPRLFSTIFSTNFSK